MRLEDVLSLQNQWFLTENNFNYTNNPGEIKSGDYLCLLHKLNHTFLKNLKVLKHNSKAVITGHSYNESSTYFFLDHYVFHRKTIRGKQKKLQKLMEEQNEQNGGNLQDRIIPEIDINTLDFDEFGNIV